MGQLDVRAAIAEYFKTANLTGVIGVYKDIPYFFNDAQWSVNTSSGWAAVIAVHIDDLTETRISLPSRGNSADGPVGQKDRLYTVSLLIQQQYKIPQLGFPGQEDEASYVDMIDILLDEVADLLHADPTMGCGKAGPIFQAAQDTNGAPSIHIAMDVPMQDNERTRIYAWNKITFPVTEIVNA